MRLFSAGRSANGGAHRGNPTAALRGGQLDQPLEGADEVPQSPGTQRVRASRTVAGRQPDPKRSSTTANLPRERQVRVAERLAQRPVGVD